MNEKLASAPQNFSTLLTAVLIEMMNLYKVEDRLRMMVSTSSYGENSTIGQKCAKILWNKMQMKCFIK
jgi:hypothetical protein